MSIATPKEEVEGLMMTIVKDQVFFFFSIDEYKPMNKKPQRLFSLS
jgi:hypothetical protein